MASGRTFKEAFQKGLRALEAGRSGWEVGQTLGDDRLTSDSPEDLRVALRTPTPERIFQIKRALVAGVSVDDIAVASGIDPWFLFQLSELLGAQGIVILGSGPNRIGQGVEFDYCCVRAGLAFRDLGFKTIMINSNPETVSTDFDISDKLYFEPLTLEDVLEIVRWERPK